MTASLSAQLTFTQVLQGSQEVAGMSEEVGRMVVLGQTMKRGEKSLVLRIVSEANKIGGLLWSWTHTFVYTL